MVEQDKLKYFTVDDVKVPIDFGGTIEVAPGVNCDTYSLSDDDSRDLAVIDVEPGCKTPLQLVVDGSQTVEHFLSGEGTLVVRSDDQSEIMYRFRDSMEPQSVEVHVGQIMQWIAGERGLVFAEICEPPYEEGRFKNISA